MTTKNYLQKYIKMTVFDRFKPNRSRKLAD